MGKHVMLDSDVVKTFIDMANRSELEKALMHMVMDKGEYTNPENDMNGALRAFLRLDNKVVDAGENYPSSKDNKIQGLLDGLRDTIFSISKGGMRCHNNRRWVANPNVVTITVHDARANNLRITVYGRPHEFDGMEQSLEIQKDMSSYSRFILDNQNQLSSAINVIKHSYKIKKDRGRL